MLRKILPLLALVAISSHALAVDEVALKASTPNPARSVLSPENAINYTGSNVGGPQWARPFADGTCCSGLGPVRYSTQLFNISANDTCDVTSVQNGFDGYLFIYRDPFNPTTQTVNFVAGDDDGAGGIGTSDIIGVALMGGTTYVAVTTGFAAGDEGSFTNTINCPTANVSLGAFVAAAPPVPAPVNNPWAMGVLLVLMGLAGTYAARRSH